MEIDNYNVNYTIPIGHVRKTTINILIYLLGINV